MDREKLSPSCRQVEILFDQDDRHVAEAALIGDGAADVLDDRTVNAFGRLVSSSSSFGRITTHGPIASCCCWPPERSPPRRPAMVFQHPEKQRDTSSGMLRSSRFTAQSRS